MDALAFIGGSEAADALIKEHPHPHRLKVFLQLEGKNLGIILPDADLETAAEQITIGSMSFNGQRCTAIKLVFVHSSMAQDFLSKFVPKIDALKIGLPWIEGVQITPLPEPKKPEYLIALIKDAIAKNATLVNKKSGGGTMAGRIMRPAVVFPVTRNMRLWEEEQFGPVVPVAVYDDIQEIYDYIKETRYGQQASVFTTSSKSAAPLIDILSTAVGRININTQCGRSPDSLPFSGRRSSAMGTMSIQESLNLFSTETLVAGKDSDSNREIAHGLDEQTKFLQAF